MASRSFLTFCQISRIFWRIPSLFYSWLASRVPWRNASLLFIPWRFLDFFCLSKRSNQTPLRLKQSSAFLHWKHPEQLLSWLQTANFSRRFYCDCFKVAGPLQAVFRNADFKWASERKQTLKLIGLAPTSAPILGHFDANAPTKGATEASAIALSAMFTQTEDRKKDWLNRPVDCSRNLSINSTATFGKLWLWTWLL